MKLYQELAPYYFDIEKPSRALKKEFQFLVNEFESRKLEKILDAGCGSGEHVAHLDHSGFTAVGLDNSPQMLDVARRRFPKSRFILNSMEKFRPAEKFDAIFSLFGSVNYLLKDEELKAALYNFHTILDDDGVMILEVWHSFPLRLIKRKPLSNVASIISHERVIHRNRGFRLLKSDKKTIVEVNYIYNIDGQDIKDRHIMRAYDIEEFRGFLKGSRFKIVDMYGDLGKSRVKDSTGRLIYVCQKK